MKRSTQGAVLLVLLGVVTIGLWKLASWLLFDPFRGSDEPPPDLTIRIGGDGYLGYWFITSQEIKKQASRVRLGIEFTDDGGAYAQRLEKFAKGEYDAIVLPVNSYLQHGAAHKFPGVIVAAISESKGADGIVGFADRFPQGKVSELNVPGMEIVYTADSPSSFLLDLTIVDFDLYNLRASDTWRAEVGGSREAFDRAKSKRGDAFVMWEPELSRALVEVPNLKYIWGSDKFGGYIIDVFVFHRSFLKKHEAEVTKFLEAYFMSQRVYANDRNRLLAEMKTSTKLDTEVLEATLSKIDWYTLHENGRNCFGLRTAPDAPATDGVANCILACMGVLVRTGRLPADPLGGNPFAITNSSLLKTLLDRAPKDVGQGSGGLAFAALDERGWARLREAGTMRVEPITFQSGENQLDDEGKEQVDKIASALVNNYPDYRVAVRGHTGPGDEEANRVLSAERAQAVAQRLIAVHHVPAERVHAEGKGSSQPPPRKPNESERAYRYRLPRVEFVLLEENRL